MMFNQARLGITPESFKAVDVDSATGEALAMVNVEMPVATKSQGIVDTELVGIDQATALDLAEGLFHQCLRFDVRHDGHRHAPAPLQNAENRYFPGRCPTAFSFPWCLSFVDARAQLSQLGQTVIFLPAARPLFAFRRPPRYDSSASTSRL